MEIIPQANITNILVQYHHVHHGNLCSGNLFSAWVGCGGENHLVDQVLHAYHRSFIIPNFQGGDGDDDDDADDDEDDDG